jgi:hypothetical protein
VVPRTGHKASLTLAPAFYAYLTFEAAEQPLDANLDVAGLKEQVLGRLETLEKREREWQELLIEIVPLMGAREYETGSLSAAMGG